MMIINKYRYIEKFLAEEGTLFVLEINCTFALPFYLKKYIIALLLLQFYTQKNI